MQTDLAIVGAGPAGLEAGIEAARHGLRCVLLDENPAAGGRIWQAQEQRDADEGRAVIRAFHASGVEAHFNASVWGIEPDGAVFWTENGAARSLRARRILLACGTIERPLPIPGWTLPGVMTVGAAQIALKTSGLVPDKNTWIAGRGPLIFLYAVQVLRAGGTLGGILDLGDPAARWRAARYLPGAIADLWKGLTWINEIRRSGIPWLRVTDLRAEGDGALSKVSFTVRGQRREAQGDLLLLHDGVVPSIQITRALGCAHEWNERQRCWHPITNPWAETSVPGLLTAGDNAGIGGAEAAGLSGRIAALGCAQALGFMDVAARGRAAAPLRARHARLLASRPFIDTLFTPVSVPPDDATLVCRCEEVSAGAIREAVRLGCLGLNQLKAYTRCGMGPCQGRMCGTSAGEILALARGLHPRDIEPFRTRFPARPLTVGELATLDP